VTACDAPAEAARQRAPSRSTPCVESPRPNRSTLIRTNYTSVGEMQHLADDACPDL
jgi:hypothetical protein